MVPIVFNVWFLWVNFYNLATQKKTKSSATHTKP